MATAGVKTGLAVYHAELVKQNLLSTIFRANYKNVTSPLLEMSMHVTSFLGILYQSNSEYWAQKRAQSGNIHSIMFNSPLSFIWDDKKG